MTALVLQIDEPNRMGICKKKVNLVFARHTCKLVQN